MIPIPPKDWLVAHKDLTWRDIVRAAIEELGCHPNLTDSPVRRWFALYNIPHATGPVVNPLHTRAFKIVAPNGTREEIIAWLKAHAADDANDLAQMVGLKKVTIYSWYKSYGVRREQPPASRHSWRGRLGSCGCGPRQVVWIRINGQLRKKTEGCDRYKECLGTGRCICEEETEIEIETPDGEIIQAIG